MSIWHEPLPARSFDGDRITALSGLGYERAVIKRAAQGIILRYNIDINIEV